jgi:ribosomal protein S2
MCKIPCISVVDTDTWTQVSSLAIPGNDESLGCIIFYNDIVSNFVLVKKFSLVAS